MTPGPTDTYVFRSWKEFVDHGILDQLNQCVGEPHGITFGIYYDDDTGQTSPGWTYISNTEANEIGILNDFELRIERQAAFDVWIAQVRAEQKGS